MKKFRMLAILCLSFLLLSCSDTITQQKKLSKEALKMMDVGDFDIAIEKFDTALSLGNSNKSLYEDILMHKSLCQFELALYKDAISSLKNIESLNNDAKSLMVIFLSRDGEDLNSAYTYLTELAKSNPKEDVYSKAVDEFLRAIMLGDSKDFDMTLIKELNTKEYNKKKTANNSNNMGIFEYIDGNYDKALEYFDEATQIATKNTDVNIKKALLFNKAACYEYKLEPEKAIELFEEYINTYGEDEEVSHELIFLKTRIK